MNITQAHLLLPALLSASTQVYITRQAAARIQRICMSHVNFSREEIVRSSQITKTFCVKRESNYAALSPV